MSTLAPPLKAHRQVCLDNAAIVETLKALHVLVTSVMTDLAALRKTILEDPSFAVTYQAHLKAAVLTARPLLAEVLQSYDALGETSETLEEWWH